MISKFETYFYGLYRREIKDECSSLLARLVATFYISFILLFNVHTILLILESLVGATWIVKFNNMLYESNQHIFKEILILFLLYIVVFLLFGRKSKFIGLEERVLSKSRSEDAEFKEYLGYFILSAFLFLGALLLTLVSSL